MLNVRKLNESIRSGYNFLNGSIQSSRFSAELGFDDVFSRRCGLSSARDVIKSQTNLDLGFDMNQEVFSSMIGLGLLKNRLFKNLSRSWTKNCWNNRYRFFNQANGFAADTDCTAIAVTGLYKNNLLDNQKLFDTCSELMKAVPSHIHREQSPELWENVPMVYWEDGLEPNVLSRGCKQDAGVVANVLLAMELAIGEGYQEDKEIKDSSKRYLESFLKSEDFIKGTRYYSPNVVLYYASYLGTVSRDYDNIKDIVSVLTAETKPDNLLELAMQTIISDKINVPNMDYEFVVDCFLKAQNPDGSWRACPFYTLGRKKLYFGSEGITTMFALKALSIINSKV